jgi:hypothetical protein
MKEKHMNEPAFPNEGFNGWGKPFEGMTLRDYFAAKAMQGIIFNDGDFLDARYGSPENIAVAAYHMADAMLKAREE